MTAPAAPSKPCLVALVGNPNTGKTTLFNALSGLHQRVGNYPGVTVETKKGRCSDGRFSFDLIDLPGTYSLAARSPDEMVAVDVILGRQAGEARPDVVVSVVDASNLERNLYLTTQAFELGVPVVVALSMTDVAASLGVRVDADQLAKRLGVPVVPIQANKRKGLDRLKQTIAEAAAAPAAVAGPPFPESFEHEAVQLSEAIGPGVDRFLVRRLLLDAGGWTEKRLCGNGALNTSRGPIGGKELGDLVKEARERLAAAGCAVPAVEARSRYAWIRRVTDGCVQRPAHRPRTMTDRLDRVLTHPLWGTVIFFVLMFVVFESIFEWARPAMRLISAAKDVLAEGVHAAMPAGPLTSLLTDGVIEGVGAVVVFLPQIVILFAFIAVLEDCGYMARAAFLMDKLMARCGLSGKSFIPMLSSVACAVPGIMATRVIEDRRDRLTTILVAPLMSCSARLPVYTLLIAAFLPVRDESHPNGYAWWVPGLAMIGMYALGLFVAPVVALVLKRTLLRGDTPVFVMEMPVYKLPSLGTVLRRMTDSAGAFLLRAGTLILASMVVVWALLYFPTTDEQGRVYPELLAQQEATVDRARAELTEQTGGETAEHRAELENVLATAEQRARHIQSEWKRGSWLGRLGRAVEPAVRPLGWDWRIGMAALASFPAREVVVGTLGIIYHQGRVEADEIREAADAGTTPLAIALKNARWDCEADRPVFTLPTAFSLMVFFALCCQCASTLAVIRRETNSWRWPAFTFSYMTLLAYAGALLTYQVGIWVGRFAGQG